MAEFYFGYKAGSRCHSPSGVAVERVQGQTPNVHARAHKHTHTNKLWREGRRKRLTLNSFDEQESEALLQTAHELQSLLALNRR